MSKAKLKEEVQEAKAIQTRSVNILQAWGKRYNTINQSSARAREEQVKLMKDLVIVRDKITSELPGYFTWKRISTIVNVPEPTLKFYYRIGSHKEVHQKFVKEGALYAFKSEKRGATKRGRKNEADKLISLHKALALSGENVSNYVQLIQRLLPKFDARCKSCGFPTTLTMVGASFKALVEGKDVKVTSATEVTKHTTKEIDEAHKKVSTLPFQKHTEKGSARQSTINETLHP